MIRNCETNKIIYRMHVIRGLDSDYFYSQQDLVVHQDIFHEVFVTAVVFLWKSLLTLI